MDNSENIQPRRVLIASANPLFSRGLQKLFQEKWGGKAEIIGITANLADTIKAMEKHSPDLVVVDYDDKTINRTNILNEFVEGEGPMQIILVSLKGNGSAVVYDRQTLTPTQAGDLLDIPQLQPSLQKIGRLSGWTNRRRFALAAAIVLAVSTLVLFLMSRVRLLPVEASQQAGVVDRLFRFHFGAIAFLWSLIIVFMILSIIFFRRRKGDEGDGVHRRGNNRLEIAWTIVPLITVLAISTFGASNLAQTLVKDPQAMVVNVTAGQWYWSFEYPKAGVTSQTLNLPVNRQVLLRMTSRDVIHSFWVPEFRVKQDILPGDMVRELRITPTLQGTYKVRCAEMCGASHAYMESPVIVMDQAAFDAWIQEQVSAVTADPGERGAKLAQVNGCIGCHSSDGKDGVGPTWKSLFGSQVSLASGETLTADEAYIHESIVDPAAKVSAGFQPGLMPTNYGKILTEQQIGDLIAYIQSLK